jgi:hypothetical protein
VQVVVLIWTLARKSFECRYMKISQFLKVSILTLSIVGMAEAVEMRMWANLKGQKIEAELLSVLDDDVRLRMKNGRDVTIKRSTLSAADQKYLTEYGGAEEIAPATDGKVGMPEKSMRFDSKSLKKPDEAFHLPEGYSLSFDIIESDHFLILSTGSVRGKDTAELAERLWYAMSFQHPGFKEKWGTKKRAVFLCDEHDEFLTLGKYNEAELKKSDPKNAADFALTWPQASSGGINLDSGLCEKYNVMSGARAFRCDSQSSFKSGVWNPFPVHCLAQDVLRVMMGGAGGGVGSEGYFAIMTGQGYFKEIQLAEETVTKMIDADSYAGDEITNAGGFDDGRKWARTLKSLVKKGKVKPDLNELYRIKDATMLTPATTVLMYSLVYYMQSTPARMANFSKTMNRVDTGRAIPAPVELAKLFGFETVDDFVADWKTYIESTDFR